MFVQPADLEFYYAGLYKYFFSRATERDNFKENETILLLPKITQKIIIKITRLGKSLKKIILSIIDDFCNFTNFAKLENLKQNIKNSDLR